MTAEERRNRYPHGELIIPGGHIVLRSIYQFRDSAEVYAFLHGCMKEHCSVCFQNEGIDVNSEGTMSIPEIGIAVYMHMKTDPNMVGSYLHYLVKSNRGEWATDRVEVI